MEWWDEVEITGVLIKRVMGKVGNKGSKTFTIVNENTLAKNINVGKSSSKEILKTNLKKKLDLNFKIPLHRINTELLVSPIEH